jgi:hypothetical protein
MLTAASAAGRVQARAAARSSRTNPARHRIGARARHALIAGSGASRRHVQGRAPMRWRL